MTRSQRLYEIRRRVIQILEKLAEEIDADVYLFGSYARGDHLIDSDVDILVVSEKFKDVWPADRVALVRQRLPADIGFDITALTPNEMKDSILVKEISKEWVEIRKDNKHPTS